MYPPVNVDVNNCNNVQISIITTIIDYIVRRLTYLLSLECRLSSLTFTHLDHVTCISAELNIHLDELFIKMITG